MKKILLILSVSLLFLVGISRMSFGSVSSCEASLLLHQFSADSFAMLEFQVYNSSSSTINWVKFTRPNTDYIVFEGETTTGWSFENDESTVTFTGQTLPVSASYYFGVRVRTEAVNSSNASWTVEVSDDGGTSKTTCTGNMLTSITTGDPDYDQPAISDVSVSSLTSSSAKISWTTNEAANSVVDYGTTAGYGATKSDSNLVTTHSVDVTSLSANTTYHYRIQSIDAAGNETFYGDATFTTAVATVTPTPITTTTTVTVITSTTPLPVPTPLIVVFEDKVAPVVEILTDLTKPFKQAPLVTGTVVDNAKGNVVTVEYTIDGGRSWFPMQNVPQLGAEQTEFSFLPEIRDDGDYIVQVRAKDAQGNSGESQLATLVIDRLEPRIGGAFVSLGTQPLPLARDGNFSTVAGLDQKITLSTVGGATLVDIVVKGQMFSLVKNPHNGLWSGTLSFQDPGEYELLGRTVDGAGNRTERVLGTATVIPKGRVTATGIPSRTRLTVYTFEDSEARFVEWDARPYGQVNPQSIQGTGEYNLVLPEGKYYISVTASGYRKAKTAIFELTETTPLNTLFELTLKQGFHIGSWYIDWFDWNTTMVEVAPSENVVPTKQAATVGSEVPVVTFGTGATAFSTYDLYGKPTVLTFLASWLPQTSTQLTYLEQLVDHPTIEIVVMFEQEKASMVETLRKRGHYTTRMLADPDGELLVPLGIHSFPTHLFLDRRGVVVDQVVGLLTNEQIVGTMEEKLN